MLGNNTKNNLHPFYIRKLLNFTNVKINTFRRNKLSVRFGFIERKKIQFMQSSENTQNMRSRTVLYVEKLKYIHYYEYDYCT